MSTYTILSVGSDAPLFVYNGSKLERFEFVVKEDVPQAQLDMDALAAIATQAKSASAVHNSASFNYDSIQSNVLVSGFSFGRYPGILFKPYDVHALIAFAVTSKYHGWAVTRLYPHWSAACDFVDRHALDVTMSLASNIVRFATQFADARVNFAFTGLSPGILPHEDYEALYAQMSGQSVIEEFSRAYEVTESLQFDAANAAAPIVITKGAKNYTAPRTKKSKPPKVMRHANTLQECFAGIGALISGYEPALLTTTDEFLRHARRYSPNLQLKFDDDEMPHYDFAIESSDDPDQTGFFWGQATQ
ncbi:MAG: hypothetical protein CL678_01010 [Bdellovibrionaceae bacterium]|nr:hypothetical protein [Pseudobdellovibrionaceae bacterium]|tara:strand:+ start:2283 stop:3194 length:912 start_codon:yes stop_codon:yes gene_type:complete